MNFLPVVQRELLVAARNGAGVWFRFVAALGGVGFFALLWMTPVKAQPQLVSDIVFRVLAGALFGFGLLSGSLYTADAMTSEKREGTLGLLFLTELRGYDIVLGKLVSTSLRAAYGVIALVPVLSLPVLVGGVSGGQVVRAVMVILVTLLISLSIGMMASVVAREFRGALMASLLAVGLLSVGLDGGGWLWARVVRTNADPVRTLSPLAAFRWSQAEPRKAPGLHALYQQAWRRQALLALVLLGASSWMIRRYRDRVIESRPGPVGEGKVRRGSLVGYRHVHWGDILERRPYEWFQLVMRPVERGGEILFYALGAGLVVALGVSLAVAGTPTAWWAIGAGLFLLWSMHILLKVHVALAATRGIAEDRASGALELLVVAGQGRDQIIQGHNHALFRQHRVAMILLSCLQFLPLFRLSMDDVDIRHASGIFIGLVYGVAMLWVDLETLAQVGLRQGLKEPSPQAAFRATFLRVLLPGWIGMLPLAVIFLTGAGAGVGFLAFHLWLAWSVYTVYRARKRARIDLEHGFQALAAGLDFDTDDWEMRDDFRRAAGAQYPAGGLRSW